MTAPLLSLRDVVKHFRVDGGFFDRAHRFVHAVDGVSLDVAQGETVGLVGESGCGKSTLGRVALRLLDPDGGTVAFDGADITNARGEVLRGLRRSMQIVFQDPYSSLNPRMRVGDIVSEGWVVHGEATGREARERAKGLLERVGLPASAASRYPHEFSGGQRQRIGIARAIALSPKLVVADEPVSSLDVSVQAQILNLLADIREADGIAFLFVSHDLRVIRHVSDRVAVMYLGLVVEEGPSEELFEKPLHPYTRALLSAAPSPGESTGERIVLTGDLPSSSAPPAGCRFHTRCFMAKPACRETVPPLGAVSPVRRVACPYF